MGGSEEIMDNATNEFLDISLQTDMSVAHLPDLTQVINKIHIFRSRHSSRSVARMPANCNVSFLAASEDFARSKSYLELLSATL